MLLPLYFELKAYQRQTRNRLEGDAVHAFSPPRVIARAERDPMSSGTTLFEKIWDAHVVKRYEGGRDLVFIDRHILQETTCTAAFAGLRREGRTVAHPELTLATQDHIISTAPDRD